MMKKKKEIEPFFEKNTTYILKGILILCMFVHHFFTFPSYYIESINYPNLVSFAKVFKEPFKICVPVFAFLTGYFYAYNKEQNLKYSIRKIIDILITYWLVYFIFILIGVILGIYHFYWKDFLLELFGLYRPVMRFCWYVPFYCFAMILLPFLKKHLNRSKMSCLIYGIVLPVFLGTILKSIIPNIEKINLTYLITRFTDFFPCISIGYFCSKYHVFEQERQFIERAKWCNILVMCMLIGIAFMGRYYIPSFSLGSFKFINKTLNLTFNMDIIYAPLAVFSMVYILNQMKENTFLKLLQKMGKYSLIMWFFHCVFFNIYKNTFQPILYFPKNPVLVLIWGTSISLIISMILDIPLQKIQSLKNRFFLK